jgi:hypothetical protein
MRVHISVSEATSFGVELPWDDPLLDWPEAMMVQVPRGISRNVVRFAPIGGRIVALKEIPDRAADREYRWLNEIYQPTIAEIPKALRGKLDGPDIYHQILEHRWFMSERADRGVSTEEASASYRESTLSNLPFEDLSLLAIARRLGENADAG